MEVYDYEVAHWEEIEKTFVLYVCAECGKISDEVCDQHIGDNWHLNVQAFQKVDDKPLFPFEIKSDLDRNIYGWNMRILQEEEDIYLIKKSLKEMRKIYAGLVEQKKQEKISGGLKKKC